MELEAGTAAGRRFVAAAEGHVAAFAERAGEYDRLSRFPVENFEDLKRSGLMGAFVPEALGGMGLESVHDWAAGLARLARGDASTAIALNMHLGISRVLSEGWRTANARGDAATAARNEGMLRGIAAGQLVVCATATEPGTDFLRPLTTATRVDGGFKLDGRKIFVTLSPIAHVYALNVRILAPAGAGAGAGEDQGDRIGFAFVPAGTRGLEPQDDWHALGMRASGSQSVVLRDCVVPEGSIQIAGAWGCWSPGLLMGRTLANLTLLGPFVGLAEAARDLALEAATKQSKPKFGGALAESSGFRHRIGELEIDLAAAQGVLSQTAHWLDAFLDAQGPDGPGLEDAHTCMKHYQCAKWTVHDRTIAAVSKAMDIVGGGAYLQRHPLERIYRDVRAGPFMQPFSPTEAREYVGSVALGRYPDG